MKKFMFATISSLLKKLIRMNLTIRNRLLFYFVLLVVLPTTIISVTIYKSSSDIITAKINTSIESSLNVLKISLDQKFDSINQVINSIYLNPELQDILSTERLINYHFRIDNENIIKEMAQLNKILEDHNTAGLNSNPLFPKLHLINKPEYEFNGFSDKVFDIESVFSKKWYSRIPQYDKFYICGLSSTSTASEVYDSLLIAKRIYALKHRDLVYAGILTMEIPIKDFDYMLQSFKPTANSFVYIVNNDGNILLHSGNRINEKEDLNTYLTGIIKEKEKQSNNSSSFISNQHASPTLVSYKYIPSLHLTIFSVSPLSDLNAELNYFKVLVYGIIFLCMLLAMIAAFLLSDNISRPIRKLVGSMSGIRNGNFTINLVYKRKDEFSILIDSYKEMVNEINTLITKLYTSEIEKKEAELIALQAQINPHFLYNTLDSVNWLALKHQVPDISTMVKSLSNFFRYSLSKGKSIITLRDEKLQVESYLCIQKIRFKDKLDYSLQFDQDVLDCLTVKLILQPIVENAIIHGIERISGPGKINITAEKKGTVIEIKISDNGAGADIDQLNQLMGDSSSSKSYGIKNVNNRIKQYFGDQYGLLYIPNEPNGITAIITIPEMKVMEDSNVKNDHS